VRRGVWETSALGNGEMPGLRLRKVLDLPEMKKGEQEWSQASE
jgi:hypothetical protein